MALKKTTLNVQARILHRKVFIMPPYKYLKLRSILKQKKLNL